MKIYRRYLLREVSAAILLVTLALWSLLMRGRRPALGRHRAGIAQLGQLAQRLVQLARVGPNLAALGLQPQIVCMRERCGNQAHRGEQACTDAARGTILG